METTIVEPMKGRDVGRIIVPMKLESFDDLVRVADDNLPLNQVRSLDVSALVDTGANFVSLPTSMIASLVLRHMQTKRARTAAGSIEQRIFSPVRVTVQERAVVSSVAELPEDSSPLLGQLPLEELDFWIDIANRRLVGNPEHGGEWMSDMF